MIVALFLLGVGALNFLYGLSIGLEAYEKEEKKKIFIGAALIFLGGTLLISAIIVGATAKIIVNLN